MFIYMYDSRLWWGGGGGGRKLFEILYRCKINVLWCQENAWRDLKRRNIVLKCI